MLDFHKSRCYLNFYEDFLSSRAPLFKTLYNFIYRYRNIVSVLIFLFFLLTSFFYSTFGLFGLAWHNRTFLWIFRLFPKLCYFDMDSVHLLWRLTLVDVFPIRLGHSSYISPVKCRLDLSKTNGSKINSIFKTYQIHELNTRKLP